MSAARAWLDVPQSSPLSLESSCSESTIALRALTENALREFIVGVEDSSRLLVTVFLAARGIGTDRGARRP
jgi:hypothetical protein